MWWLNVPRDVFVVCSLAIIEVGWVLLPLVPAVSIYRLFPNTSVAVSGQLSKLTVRASGAFAAYLIVFVVMIPLTQKFATYVHGMERPVWTVRGDAEFDYIKGKSLFAPEGLLERLVLETEPDRFSHKTYRMTLKVPEESDGQLPNLIIKIEQDKYWKGAVILNDEIKNTSTNNVDYFNKIIDIKHPIIIQEYERPGNYGSESGMEK